MVMSDMNEAELLKVLYHEHAYIFCPEKNNQQTILEICRRNGYNWVSRNPINLEKDTFCETYKEKTVIGINSYELKNTKSTITYSNIFDVNGSGFAGKSGDVGGDYKPEASGMCKKPDDVDCDQALYVGIFHPQGASRKVGEGVFSGVQPVNWSCSGKSAASQKGIELIYDPQGHFVGSNGTVAFGSFKDAGGSRKVNSPAQFVIIDTVGSIRRGEDSKGQECL